MKWKSFMLGACVGLVSGYATKELLSHKSTITPEKTLADAKLAFKDLGPISGSWIQMKTEPFKKHDLLYTVYKGGITTNQNGINEQYEFISDAHTGTIIEVMKL